MTNDLVLRLRDDQYEALAVRAEATGRPVGELVAEAVDAYLERAAAADREAVRRTGAEYAERHADLLRRLGE
ncbi:CopG family transcriptional regulator [Streptomyces sp. NPDC003691]